MLKKTIGLIPRYNWDMKLPDLIAVLRAPFRKPEDAQRAFSEALGGEPLFTGSGRTALYLILKAFDLPRGSKVGVPLFCCPVVFDSIQRAGLVPRFVDINLDDYCLSAADLREKRGDLSAVIVVHMFGHPADMDSILPVCGGLPVIEDCAHSLFSRYKGQLTGFFSDAAFFTFRSGKYLSAGEGSAVVARDSALRDRIEKSDTSLKRVGLAGEILHGLSTYVKSAFYRRPWYGTVGRPIGGALDSSLNLSAKTGFEPRGIRTGNLALINRRLPTFIQRIQKQRRNSLLLLDWLKISNVSLPHERPGCWSNYYQFAVLLDRQERRDRLAAHLLREGVDAAPYLDEIGEKSRRDYGYKGDCPTSEHAGKRTLVLPNHYTLSGRDLDRIIRAVNESGI